MVKHADFFKQTRTQEERRKIGKQSALVNRSSVRCALTCMGDNDTSSTRCRARPSWFSLCSRKRGTRPRQLTGEVFPEHDIRLVAVSDGIDTDGGEDDGPSGKGGGERAGQEAMGAGQAV